MQTRGKVKGLHNCQGILPTPWVFISGYANAGKKFSIALQNYFSEKKTKLFEREILTSCKVLYTKLCMHIVSSRFAKSMLSKIWIFLVENVSEKNWHSMFVKIFQVLADKENGK